MTLGYTLYFTNVYTYIGEVVGGKLRVIFTSLAFCTNSVCAISINLVSIEYNHYSFYIYSYAICLALGSLSYFYFVESPFYLYKQRNMQRLYQSLLTICKRNYARQEFPLAKSKLQATLRYGRYFTSPTEPKNELEKSNSLERLDDQANPSDTTPTVDGIDRSDSGKTPNFHLRLFFTRKYLCLFLKLMFLMLQLELVLGLDVLINKDLGISNIFLSGALVGMFQAIGFTCGALIIPRLKRRTVNMLGSGSISVLSLVLLAIDIVSKQYWPYADRSGWFRVAETGKRDKSWHSGSCF